MGIWMFMHQLLVWLLTPANYVADQNSAFWLSVVVSVFLWPLIFISLRTLRRNMHIR
jgi:cell shape-determining protein MreD